MVKTVLVLADGTELSSGAGTTHAIARCSLTQWVNSGTELAPGAVCAAMAELRLITPGGLSLAAGDSFTLFRESPDGTREQVGVFLAEKPTRPSAHTLAVTAYDRISLLDRDLTQWLAGLTGWPYTLYDLARLVCDACGVTLAGDSLPNGSFLVQPFTASGVTGRQLLQWIGQAAGRFCRANAQGQLEFAWYTPLSGCAIGPREGQLLADAAFSADTAALALTADALAVTAHEGAVYACAPALSAAGDGAGTVTLTLSQAGRQYFYYRDGLTLSDYGVKPVEKVQLRARQTDVGTVCPQTQGQRNTYCVTGNPLLAAQSDQTLQLVAQTLYELLRCASYTPCRVSVSADMPARPGHILTVTDASGRTGALWVMGRCQEGGRATLECTGSPSRDSTTAVNETSWRSLTGKLLALQTDVDGIRAENKAADGRLASLDLTVDGLSAQVRSQSAQGQSLQTQLTGLQQTAQALSLSVRTIRETGVSRVCTESSYTFDDNGLRIARSGEMMENRLDNTGMYVTRAGQTVLQASDDGVTAADVQVRNYLCVGACARFEDYGAGRTACFYTGG